MACVTPQKKNTYTSFEQSKNFTISFDEGYEVDNESSRLRKLTMTLSQVTMELEQERALRHEAETKLDYLMAMMEHRNLRAPLFDKKYKEDIGETYEDAHSHRRQNSDGLDDDSSDDGSTNVSAYSRQVTLDDDETPTMPMTSSIPMCVYRSLERYAKALKEKNDALSKSNARLLSADRQKPELYPVSQICSACLTELSEEDGICPECLSETRMFQQYAETYIDCDDDSIHVTPCIITEDLDQRMKEQDEDPRTYTSRVSSDRPHSKGLVVISRLA